MIGKYIKSARLTHFFRENFSTTPVTFKYFKNTRDPQSRFVVRQMLAEESEEVAQNIADVYLTRENVLRTLAIPRDQFVDYIKNDVKNATQSNLAIVCRDERTNKLAGSFYCQDMRILADERVLFTPEQNDPKWQQFDDFYKACFLYLDTFAMPKGLNEIIYCKRIAVDKEYSQLTVGNNMMFAARFLHPKITTANKFLIIATHEYTYNFCKMNGFELVKKISYKSFRDRNNRKIFENMQKLKGRSEADDFVYVMKREKSEKSIFQEIKALKQS